MWHDVFGKGYAVCSFSDGVVTITGCNTESLKDKNVIVVEDIIDTGRTMKELLPYLEGFGTKSVSVLIILSA